MSVIESKKVNKRGIPTRPFYVAQLEMEYHEIIAALKARHDLKSDAAALRKALKLANGSV